jgi:hypothetical protein
MLLRGFVRDFWLYDGYAAQHLRERILPSGTIELVINLREDELRIYNAARPLSAVLGRSGLRRLPARLHHRHGRGDVHHGRALAASGAVS